MKYLLSLLLLVSAVFAAGEPDTKVLLAMENTPFKTALVNEMKVLLKKNGAAVVVLLDHKKGLKKVKTENYDLIFITNSGVKSKVRPWVKSWIEANMASKEKILLHTTKTKKWSEGLSVDMVSSASAKKEVKTLAKQYVDALLQKLKK